VGTPEHIADAFQDWLEAGVDGFNLAYAVTPGSFIDFIDGVVPVLQKRGVMQKDYQEGTLREKLFGRGRARVQSPHPAAAYRRPSSDVIHVPAPDSGKNGTSVKAPVAAGGVRS
jgi:hypothetical protein